MRSTFAGLVLALLLATSVFAAEPTQLALSETASRDIATDRVIAVLEGRGEAPRARAAQERLNEMMTAALAAAAEASAIEVESRSYRVFPVRRDGRTTGWVATQAVALETDDRAQLLALTGELQELGLTVEHLGGTLSDETIDRVRDELLIEALQGLEARLEIVVDTLGLTFAGWQEIGIDGARPEPRPMMAEAMVMRAADAAAPSAPVLAETRSTVRVSVRATALLMP